MNTLLVARSVIAELQARFPDVRFVEDQGAPVELSVSIPVQPGIRHRVWLGLQNVDELSFGVGSFQFEWFPCTDPARVESFTNAVAGYLSGDHRILEFYRRGKCVRAELQVQDATFWKTLVTWSNLGALIPGRTTTRELRNT